MYDVLYSITDDSMNTDINNINGVIGIFLIYIFFSTTLWSINIKNNEQNPYIGRYGPCKNPLFTNPYPQQYMDITSYTQPIKQYIKKLNM